MINISVQYIYILKKMVKKHTQKNKKKNNIKFTKPSACTFITQEDQCRMPCKPVYSKKRGRKFLHCRTAISYEKMEKLMKKQDTATRKKFNKPMKKAKKLNNDVKKAEKVVEKKTQERDGIIGSIRKGLGAAGIISVDDDEKKEENPQTNEEATETESSPEESPETDMPVVNEEPKEEEKPEEQAQEPDQTQAQEQDQDQDQAQDQAQEQEQPQPQPEEPKQEGEGKQLDNNDI